MHKIYENLYLGMCNIIMNIQYIGFCNNVSKTSLVLFEKLSVVGTSLTQVTFHLSLRVKSYENQKKQTV